MRTIDVAHGESKLDRLEGRKGYVREHPYTQYTDFASRSPLPRRERGVLGGRGGNRLDGRPRDRLVSLSLESQRSGAGASRKGGRSTITAARGRGVILQPNEWEKTTMTRAQS